MHSKGKSEDKKIVLKFGPFWEKFGLNLADDVSRRAIFPSFEFMQPNFGRLASPEQMQSLATGKGLAHTLARRAALLLQTQDQRLALR